MLLSGPAGSIEVMDRPALTTGAGDHPLIDGVGAVTVTGLKERPVIDASDGVLELTADGVRAVLDRAEVVVDGQVVRLRLASADVGSPGLEAPPTGSGTPVAEARLEAARQALTRHDFGEAGRLLETVLAASPDETVAAVAYQLLANLAWRVRGDHQVGREYLERALELSAHRSGSFAELSRLERHAARYEQAWSAADSARAAARTPAQALRATLALAYTGLAEAEAGLRDGDWPGPRTMARLAPVRDELAHRVDREPGLLAPAALLLPIALLLDDGPAAHAAWRSYYLAVGDQPGPIPAARRTLERTLTGWAGAATPRADRLAAIEALTASGMIGPARLLALDPRLSPELDPLADPAAADLVAYAAFLDEARELAEAFYRATAVGEGESAQWPFRDAVVARGRDLLDRVSWGDSVARTESPWGTEVIDALAQRYGTYLHFGRTAGFFGLMIAHTVIDDRRTVQQYGHQGEFRFIAVDGIAVTDYQTWSWDGNGMTGGSATADRVLQVRPGYADGGLRAWEEVQRAAPARELIGGDDPCGYVPGLRTVLRRQGLEQVRDSLTATGLAGSALRSAFLAEYHRATLESSIFAHEGRHVIDMNRGMADSDSEELEYGAKKSQVVFAPFPRLALGSIMGRNIGDPTPHGQANRRVLCDVVDWMREHRAEIHGFDDARPVLIQLPLLTDDQLREAFGFRDPLVPR